MNKLKRTPANKYSQNELEQIEQVNEILKNCINLFSGYGK